MSDAVGTPELFPDVPTADARRTDPRTSRIAAAALDVETEDGTPRKRGRRVVSAALAYGPATDDELRARIDDAGVRMAHGSVSKRRCDLVADGLAHALLDREGREVFRPTRSGCPAIVWKLAGWDES